MQRDGIIKIAVVVTSCATPILPVEALFCITLACEGVNTLKNDLFQPMEKSNIAEPTALIFLGVAQHSRLRAGLRRKPLNYVSSTEHCTVRAQLSTLGPFDMRRARDYKTPPRFIVTRCVNSQVTEVTD